MEEFQIWQLWSSNQIGAGLGGIGVLLSIWLAMRIAAATRNSDETNLFGQIVSSAFGIIVLVNAWVVYNVVANLWISTAAALTELKTNGTEISSVAEGYITYVGTTEAASMPTPLGIAFIVVSALIILGQIWMPKD